MTDRQLRDAVVVLLTQTPGIDAEEIAEILDEPLAEVAEIVAELCAEGALAPEEP